MPRPVFLVIAEDGGVREELSADLRRRFAADYRVVGAAAHWFFDGDSAEGRALLGKLGLDGSRLPVAAHFDGTVLIEPSDRDIMAKLGLRTHPNVDTCDVAIVGAGPAGLAAAVYAASEGLSTLVLERAVPGGQAGTSSLIRNYLGFPRGLSGEDLTNRALEQAWLFGSHLVVSQSAIRLTARGSANVVQTSDGSEVTARAVVLATGVSWRRLGVPTLEALTGAGVFYGAAAAEARAMRDRDVFVVGSGNSAGQAAIHLAKYAARVTMVVRGADLSSSMSDYLITEISKTPNIDVRLRTEIFDGSGRTHLETLVLRNRDSDAIEVTPAAALFLMIGAKPHTEWLGDRIERDDQGFILTGRATCTEPGHYPPPGHSNALRSCWRPASRASSPRATCDTGQRNVSPPP